MAYKTIKSEDRILFFLSDTEVIELSSHDKIKQLVEASAENLEQLIDDIKTNLRESVEEELELFDTEDVSLLQKTVVYAKLLQVVNHYRYIEKQEAARKAEEEERQANQDVWSWEK